MAGVFEKKESDNIITMTIQLDSMIMDSVENNQFTESMENF